MAKVDVLDLNGKKVGSLELPDEVFGVINEDLLWEAVKHYRAGQRAGTHATKNKKLVSGSGKKLWKQRAPDAPAWVRSDHLSGATAARFTDLNLAATITSFPKRNCLERCARRLPASSLKES